MARLAGAARIGPEGDTPFVPRRSAFRLLLARPQLDLSSSFYGSLWPATDDGRHRVASVAGTARRQILDFARARLGGGIPIVRGPVELHALVVGTVADFRASHPDRAIELDFEATCSGEWDADRLVQVLSNLVGNALDYGDRGRPVRVSVRDEGARVRIDIHNDGPPISPEFLPVIFDPFRRGVAAGGKRATSVGLGLYIAQQIVHAHGGTLSVVSTAEQGTNFTAVLPRASALPPESTPRPR
jgi:signal transduction histidine kinase